MKIGAKVASHGRYITFQLAEDAIPRRLFAAILSLIDELRLRAAPAWAGDIDGPGENDRRGVSGWRKTWTNGLPNEGRPPKSDHRMAAEGMQCPWRSNGGTISPKLGVIWEMSVKPNI